MANESEVNLDTLVFRIEGPNNTVNQIILNDCLKPESRSTATRVSSDLDYALVRQKLEQHGIPLTSQLLAGRDGDNDTVEDAEGFSVFLTTVQLGRFPDTGPKYNPSNRITLRAVDKDLPPNGEKGKTQVESDPSQTPSGTNEPSGPSNDKVGSTGEATDLTEPPEAPTTTKPKKTTEGPTQDNPDQSINPDTNNPNENQDPKISSNPKEEVEISSDSSPSTSPQDKGKGKETEELLDLKEMLKTSSDSSLSPSSQGKGKEVEQPVSEQFEGTDQSEGASRDDGNAVMGDIPRQLERQSEEYRKRTAEWFHVPITSESFRIPGIKVHIKMYQAIAVYRCLTQIDLDIGSFLLGDDVGLGKTAMTWTVIVLYHQIMTEWAAVRNWWRTYKIDTKKMLHLPRFGQLRGETCPTQDSKTRNLRFICPCVMLKETYRIAQKLVPLPSVIICPPELIDSWNTEKTKFVDPKRSPLQVFTTHAAYNNAEKQKASGLTYLSPTEARSMRATRDARKEYQLTPNGTQSNKVIIVSSRGAESFMARFQDQQNNLFAASIVVMDEAHSYKGSIANPTRPFQMLRTIVNNSQHPVLAVGLSGSMINGGPTNYVGFMDHTRALAAKHQLKVPVSSLTDPQVYERLVANWNYIITHKGLDNTGRVEKNLQKRDRELKKDLWNILPAMGVFRSKSVLGFIPKPIQTLECPCPMRDYLVQQSHKALATRVATWAADYHRRQVEEWKEGGKEGEEPTMASVTSRVLENIVTGRPVTESYNVICRSSFFPAVAWLYENDLVKYTDLLSEPVVEMATLVTNAFRESEGRQGLNKASTNRAVTDALEKSIFYLHRHRLVSSSPKYAALCKWLDEILAGSSRGIAGVKKSRMRHLIVFSESQLSNYLGFMTVFDKYSAKLKLILIHGGIQAADRAILLEPLRASTPTHPVVIFATYSQLGKGHNLQEASIAIMTEVPRSISDQVQAFGRIDRQGRQKHIDLVQMIDRNNLAEVVKERRLKNNAQLASGAGLAVQALRIEDFT
ncbi:hypothetical protein F4819DRAFT_502376 [Hypoxylon fuscum]|nr:hypothetical protein F4819DRAFT_502376 [Hypoxylon fuscum]